ncbi:unnamed protein product [Euphydryas editha]|uniref:Uncharacterized protein n=1 Tax=Euphydryas editha TaxID=104508 RepID=A0AAU9TCU2_EUPED|nr:unnamed protein product [Euphydryas editha]
MSSYVQPYPVRSYVARESPQIPQKTYITEQKTYQSYPPNYPYQTYKIAEPVSVPIAPPKPLPNPVIEAPSLKPTVPLTNTLEPPKCSGKLDSNVLNNLAIALQLLIVNNIINNPPDPNNFVAPLAESVLEMALPSKLNNHEEFQMPNSKFLGSSGFGNDVLSKAMMVNPAPPRAGLNLMSPYDAITNNYPMSESSYLSKRDFQSPYAAIMAADNIKDLFSMDFF